MPQSRSELLMPVSTSDPIFHTTLARLPQAARDSESRPISSASDDFQHTGTSDTTSDLTLLQPRITPVMLLDALIEGDLDSAGVNVAAVFLPYYQPRPAFSKLASGNRRDQSNLARFLGFVFEANSMIAIEILDDYFAGA